MLCHDAFSSLYSALRLPVLRYVLKRVKDRDVAEELTQEVFLKAYQARETYKPDHTPSAPHAWIWTIARNSLTDWYRRHRSVQMEEGEAEALPCPKPDSETMMIARSSLESLSDLQRKVLRLRLFHHLSYREISSKLGMSVDAVKCVVYRSRLALAT